jgi:hypothetical protein
MPKEFAAEVRSLAGNSLVFQERVTAEFGGGADVENEGKVIVAGDVSTIACTIYDKTAGTSQDVTITTSAITALTDDNLWTVLNDRVGRNFKHTIAGSYFPAANHVYWVVYTIVLTSGAGGDTLRFKFRVTTYAAS